MASEKDGLARRSRPMMQAPGGRQAESRRIAAKLQKHGREAARLDGFFRRPKRILKPAEAGHEKPVGHQPEGLLHAGCIGKTSLGKHVRHAHPENRSEMLRSVSLLPRDDGGKGQGKTGNQAAVAALPADNFRQARLRDATTERGVETRRSRFYERGHTLWPAIMAQNGFAAVGLPCWRVKPLGQSALDPGNVSAQGKNCLPRHGKACHAVHSDRRLFLLCSYGFQSRVPESRRI